DPESAPRALLEPLAATAQEEKALLFARGVVRDMIAEASEEPGVEAEALTDLVDSMRSAARERNSELERTKGAPGQPNSNVVAMLSLGNAEDAEEDLRLQRAQQKRDQVFLRNRARKQPLQQQSPPRLQEARQPDKDLSSCIYEPQVEEQPESPPAAEPSPTPLLDTGRADECPLAEDMQPSVCAAELNEENLQLKPRVPLEALEPSLPSLQYLMELSQDSLPTSATEASQPDSQDSLLTTSATEASQHDPEEMAAPQDSHPDASMGQSVSPKAGLPKMASDAKMKKQAKKFRHTPTPQRRLKHKFQHSTLSSPKRRHGEGIRQMDKAKCSSLVPALPGIVIANGESAAMRPCLHRGTPPMDFSTNTLPAPAKAYPRPRRTC
ncbi:URA2, partial [Symbiodinium pilosum]